MTMKEGLITTVDELREYADTLLPTRTVDLNADLTYAMIKLSKGEPVACKDVRNELRRSMSKVIDLTNQE